MKKQYFLFLMMAGMLLSMGANAQIKVGQNGSYSPANDLSAAMNLVRASQNLGNTGDTIFLTGEIAIDTAVWPTPIAAGTGAVEQTAIDAGILRYTYTIVGGGSDNTTLLMDTDAGFDAGTGALKGGFFEFAHAEAQTVANAPIVYMEGFTIKNVRNLPPTDNALIACKEGTTLSMKDVTITNADMKNNVIVLENIDSVSIVDCTFEDIKALGNVIYHAASLADAKVWGTEKNQLSFRGTNFTNCTIGTGLAGNRSVIQGRNTNGIYVEDCVFDGNTAASGSAFTAWIHPGMAGTYHMDVTVKNSVFKNNHTTNVAGGSGTVYVWNNSTGCNADIDITGSVFYKNSAAFRGPAILLTVEKGGSNTTMYNNTFAYNSVIYSEAHSRYWGGSIQNLTTGPLTMKNNIIVQTMCADKDSVLQDLFISKKPITDAANFSHNLIPIIGGKPLDTLIGNYSVAGNGANPVFEIGIEETITENNEIIPLATSTAVENGVVIEGYTGAYNGTAPDIGAFETSFVGTQAATNLVLSSSTATSVTMSWTDNSDNETGFAIIVNGVAIDSVNAGVTTYDLTDLDPAMAYELSVAAFNEIGYSAEATATMIAAPAAPQGLTWIPTSQSGGNLTWTDNSTNETGFVIMNGETELGAVAADAIMYTLSGLDTDVEYTIDVMAVNERGASEKATVVFTIEGAGVANNTLKHVHVYPVPAVHELNIGGIVEPTWSVYSVLGSMVKSGQGNRVNVSDLSDSVYLLKIVDKDGNAAVRRFVK